MKPDAKTPARVHILLSRNGRTGLAIRRGPSKSVCTVGWDRRSDKFFLGQWLRGRIYERRCDLSPDGKYLIYFAMNGRWNSEVKGAWTAISRAPYLKAISLKPKGDCWNGGGLFLSNERYWLNDGYGHELLHDTSEVKQDSSFQPSNGVGNECLGVYFPRLIRDGWELTASRKEAGETSVRVFEKHINKVWTLRKLAKATVNHPLGKGCYFDEHELVNRTSGTVLRLPAWEWADIDEGRLVWVCNGKLLTGKLSADGLGSTATLHDFNVYEYARIKAPY